MRKLLLYLMVGFVVAFVFSCGDAGEANIVVIPEGVGNDDGGGGQPPPWNTCGDSRSEASGVTILNRFVHVDDARFVSATLWSYSRTANNADVALNGGSFTVSEPYEAFNLKDSEGRWSCITLATAGANPGIAFVHEVLNGTYMGMGFLTWDSIPRLLALPAKSVRLVGNVLYLER